MQINDAGSTMTSRLTGLDRPHYLYVDSSDSIYLSDTYNHSVLLFLSNSTSGKVVAGNRVQGSNNDQLSRPYGVFVNRIGTIYIADRYNNRIMKWFSGASAGIRVAGDGTPGSSSTQVDSPTQIIVDENEYMYISEIGYGRITRWPPNSTCGVCIAACAGSPGNTSTQLREPHSLAFDSNGSLYVTDWGNHRVQKFKILDYESKYFSS